MRISDWSSDVCSSDLFEQLKEIYGASYSTLREALSSLVAEQLVVAEGQRGFRVASISAADLLDLTDARVLLEREAVRRARSEERRVGKECVSTCRSRGARHP